MNFTLENFAAFFMRLREQGLPIGPDEAGGALALIHGAGLCDRRSVRLDLRAVLAKTPKEQRVFDRCFEEYFVGEWVLRRRQEARRQADDAKLERIETGREALGDYDIPEPVAEAFAASGAERREWLRGMLECAANGNRNLPLMRAYLNKIATGWLSAEAGTGLEGADPEDEDLLHKDLAAISEDEVPQALRLIETLVRRICLAAERRRRRNGKHGQPDLRATIHRSLRTGGVPVHPIYKKRPRASQRIVLLCDISESMVRFSTFALTFITEMGRANGSGKLRVYIFSEGIEEITEQDFAHFEKRVKKSALWRRGTDIGGAADALLTERPAVIDRTALLIVLSDAKTVGRVRAEAAVRELAEKARGTVWLNPDRRLSDFAESLSATVTMIRSSSIDELARACAGALGL